MAFQVPDHLPRTATPLDYSTAVLTKISDTPSKSLNAELITSWIAELELGILQTKTLIHDRIQAHLPSFEEQLVSCRSVLSRIQTLSAQVNLLNDGVNGPTTGLLPHLMKRLTTHASLVQQASDSEATYLSLSQVSKLMGAYNSFSRSMDEGRLSEATWLRKELDDALRELPDFISSARIVQLLKDKFRVGRNRLEEQIEDAYSRSVSITSSRFVVRHSVQVRQAPAAISLADIFACFSPATLATNLNTLRRDIVTHGVDYSMRQPLTLAVGQEPDEHGSPIHTLSLFPAPPGTEHLPSRLHNLSTVMDFCVEHVLLALPENSRASFFHSFGKPVVSAVLNDLLVSHLPSNLDDLPAFLTLVAECTAFEKTNIQGTLQDVRAELEIQRWGNNVDRHYERKRRDDLLQQCRALIYQPRPDSANKRVEVVVEVDAKQAGGLNGAQHPVNDGVDEALDMDADEWGLDDDDDVQVEEEELTSELAQDANGVAYKPGPAEAGEDAWGLDDEGDPWEDDPWAEGTPGPQVDEPPATAVAKAADVPPKPIKVAKGLEKFSSKGRGSVPPSPALEPPLSPPHGKVDGTPSASAPHIPPPPPVRETYAVSSLADDVLQMVTRTIHESRQLAASGLFVTQPSSSSLPPGLLLLQSAPLMLDLFQALFPVIFSAPLDTTPRFSMRYANDCNYMSTQIKSMMEDRSLESGVQDGLRESANGLRVLYETMFDENVERQESNLLQLLRKADGFINTTHQDVFDDCETIMTDVLKQVRLTAHNWKMVLCRSDFYSATGLVIETVLSHVLTAVLSISDIPEVESHRLSELCRILNALEGLFVDETDPEAPSMIAAYVPSWLKYCYLSELLEASLVDISYLFDEGALMDFRVEELVLLVRALFSDTPMRANVIKKVIGGSP